MYIRRVYEKKRLFAEGAGDVGIGEMAPAGDDPYEKASASGQRERLGAGAWGEGTDKNLLVWNAVPLAAYSQTCPW